MKDTRNTTVTVLPLRLIKSFRQDDKRLTVEMFDIPLGRCGDRDDHTPHEHDSTTLGKFWCKGKSA